MREKTEKLRLTHDRKYKYLHPIVYVIHVEMTSLLEALNR
jgi:hypothetical protein